MQKEDRAVGTENTDFENGGIISNELDSQLLTFWLDGQMFGVSITNVAQIISMLPITEMPETPEYVKGIINLRGNIIPIVDMRLRLNKPEAEYTDRTCIVITNINNDQLGFIVDEVDAVLRVSKEQISDAPKIGDEYTNRYLNGIAKVPSADGADKIVLWLNLAKILHQKELDELNQAVLCR